MFLKVRQSILTGVFSVVGTTIGVQLGYIGTQQSFLINLLVVGGIYIGSRVLSMIISRG